jgi:hypothetical protein
MPSEKPCDGLCRKQRPAAPIREPAQTPFCTGKCRSFLGTTIRSGYSLVVGSILFAFPRFTVGSAVIRNSGLIPLNLWYGKAGVNHVFKKMRCPCGGDVGRGSFPATARKCLFSCTRGFSAVPISKRTTPEFGSISLGLGSIPVPIGESVRGAFSSWDSAADCPAASEGVLPTSKVH